MLGTLDNPFTSKEFEQLALRVLDEHKQQVLAASLPIQDPAALPPDDGFSCCGEKFQQEALGKIFDASKDALLDPGSLEDPSCILPGPTVDDMRLRLPATVMAALHSAIGSVRGAFSAARLELSTKHAKVRAAEWSARKMRIVMEEILRVNAVSESTCAVFSWSCLNGRFSMEVEYEIDGDPLTLDVDADEFLPSSPSWYHADIEKAMEPRSLIEALQVQLRSAGYAVDVDRSRNARPGGANEYFTVRW